MISALGEARKGMSPGGTCPAMAELRAARNGDFRTHDRRSVLCTLFDYIIGPGIRTSRSKVGDEACKSFMVGKDIGADARGGGER